MPQAGLPPLEPSPVEADDDGDEGDEGERPESTTAVLAFLVFMFGEFGALVFYMIISSRLWFVLDDWDFLANRTAGNIGDLFRAHNTHWSTVLVLVYRALWWTFGLRTYRPYQLVIVVMHLATALLIRAVIRRAGVRPWTATIVASILVFFGSGYANIVFPFEIGNLGSLMFGLMHLLLADHDGPIDRRDYFGLSAGLAALMCSSVGIAAVFTVGVAVLMVRGWRVALLHTIPLAAIYLVWFEAIGHEGSTNLHVGIATAAQFVRMIVAATFGSLGHISGFGVLLALLLIVGLVLAWRPFRDPAVRRKLAGPCALLLGDFALVCIIALGRAGQGTFQERSRYLYLIAAMLLPALAVAADAVMRRWRVVAPAVVVVLLIGIPGNLAVITNYMNRPIVTNQAAYRHMILSLPRVAAASQVPRSVIPDRQYAHFASIGWLLDGAASGRIPKLSHLSTADIAMDEIRLSLVQLRTPNLELPHGYGCVASSTPLLFRLSTGDDIVVGVPNLKAVITPASTSPDHTFPFRVVTDAGAILRAVRPVSFRIETSAAVLGRTCARPKILRAAESAARYRTTAATR